MANKILFISSSNLTTNPRLLKELKYACELGYSVDFIGFKQGNWSDAKDIDHIKTIKANFIYISATRKPYFSWFISSLTEYLCRLLYPLFKNNMKLIAYGHSKRSYLLIRQIKKIKKEYNVIIAHTLPTLYPAYYLAEKAKTKFTFDIEDFHPGEFIGKNATYEKQRREILMRNLLVKAEYISYAAPLIGKESLKLIKVDQEDIHGLINNCFSENEFQMKDNNSERLKFVWFSQNIAHGRGLELIIPVLEKFKNNVELHLIGNLYQNFYDTFLHKYEEFLKIHNPLSQKDLNQSLSEYDIGLAIELNTADLNRQICLTNKIWAYFQSGLYILATDTPAQKDFLADHPESGIISEQHVEKMSQNIEKIVKQIEEIRRRKKRRYDSAKKFAWETEQEKLKNIWEKII